MGLTLRGTERQDQATMRLERLGGLEVRLTGGTDGKGGGHGPVVVLLHGFGAPGDDLVALWEYLDAPQGTRFIFPAGPLTVASLGFLESRAWWMIDLEKRMREFAEGRPENFMKDVPKGLAEARERVVALLGDVDHKLGADPKRTVLGGFSQGAMLACDVALRTEQPFAGLALLSGSLVARDEWVPLMPKRKGLRVIQSHGNGDPLLPFFIAERLRDHLTAAGLAVEWVPFRGGHEIPEVVVVKVGSFLRDVLGSR